MTQRADVLAMVEEQFSDVQRQLNSQMTRMSQIQQQLDQVYRAVKLLIEHDSK
jgi:hypothetical protein